MAPIEHERATITKSTEDTASIAFLDVHIVQYLCDSSFLLPGTIFALSGTNKTFFQLLAPYISSRFIFTLRPTPYSKFSPIKLRANELEHIVKYGLPPDITFLHIKCFQRDITHYKQVEQLLNNSLSLSKIKVEGSFFMPNSFQFPPHLQELSISLPSSSQTIIENLFSLPLTTLKLSGLDYSITKLPPTIKYLKLSGCFKMSENCLSLLPQITHFIIKEMKPGGPAMRSALPSDSLLKFLPPSLIYLQLPHNTLSPCQPHSLPPKLQFLCITSGHNWPHRINTKQADLSRHYPDSLTSLELHLPSLSHLNNIPSSLVNLHIHANDFNQAMDNLPSTLRSLTIDTNPGQFSVASFKQPLDKLPTSLRYLKLVLPSYIHPLDNLPQISNFDFSCKSYTHPLNNLPDSISSLSLSISQYFHNIIKWPLSLDNLQLSTPSITQPSILYQPSLENVSQDHRVLLTNR